MAKKMSIVEGIEKYVLRPKRILIVEDDEGCVASIQACLHDYDCDFTVATDGGEALSVVAKSDFDLVFLDIKLPVCSGIEVLRFIKRIKPDTPVVVMSGYFTQDVLDDALKSGIVTFLRKPADFTQNWLTGVLRLFNLNPVHSDAYVREMRGDDHAVMA